MQNLYFIIDLTDTENSLDYYPGSVSAVCTDWNHVQKFLEAEGVIVLHQEKEYEHPIPLDETWDWLDEPNPDSDLHFWIMNPEKTRHGLQHFTVDVRQPWEPSNPRKLGYSP